MKNKRIKKINIIHILCFGFLMLLGTSLTSQQGPIYFEEVKLKTLNNDFGGMYQEMMTPFMEKKIKDGGQLAQLLFRVLSSASGDDYDYVIVDVYADFNSMYTSREDMMTMAQEVFVGQDLATLGDRFDKAVKFISNRYYEQQSEAFPGPQGFNNEAWKFVEIYHLEVEEDTRTDFEQADQKYMLPIMKHAAKEGHLNDRSLAKKIMPKGTMTGSDYLDIRMFSDWGDLMEVDPFKLFPAVHPGVDIKPLAAQFDNKVEMTHTEVWELVSMISPETVNKTTTEK